MKTNVLCLGLGLYWDHGLGSDEILIASPLVLSYSLETGWDHLELPDAFVSFFFLVACFLNFKIT